MAPLARAVLMAFSAARGVPSGFVMAHQYSSLAVVQVGSDRVHRVMTPIHGRQFCSAYLNAATSLAAFWSSVTANHEYCGWMGSAVQPNSSSQTWRSLSPA